MPGANPKDNHVDTMLGTTAGTTIRWDQLGQSFQLNYALQRFDSDGFKTAVVGGDHFEVQTLADGRESARKGQSKMYVVNDLENIIRSNDTAIEHQTNYISDKQLRVTFQAGKKSDYTLTITDSNGGQSDITEYDPTTTEDGRLYASSYTCEHAKLEPGEFVKKTDSRLRDMIRKMDKLVDQVEQAQAKLSACANDCAKPQAAFNQAVADRDAKFAKLIQPSLYKFKYVYKSGGGGGGGNSAYQRARKNNCKLLVNSLGWPAYAFDAICR